MVKPTKPRGRAASGGALSAAERMRRYRARKRQAGLRLSARWVAANDPETRTYSDHRWLDARSLALHCAIVRKIDRNPALLRTALRNIAAWEGRYGDAVPVPLRGWKRILQRPWNEIADIMTALDERSTELRQSSPFAGVLNAAERRRIYDAFRT